MSFVDEITIYAKAGKGGDGVERWRHEIHKPMGGPSGGDGGRGADVYIKAVRDLSILSKYRNQKDFIAQNGENGGKSSLHGANGEPLTILLPVGSVVTNIKTKETYRLDEEGQEILILRGGRGGRGNESFKSSTNQQPKETTPGMSGEDAEFYIELELIADIGLIGYPSAGKTSLLNTLTSARGKVGEYQFTTLEPNLGEYYGYIIADVPGLIEGAHEGKGLGDRFLRHIRRTRILVHLISLEQEDVLKAYDTIRNELVSFDPELAEKKEIVLLTKTDTVEQEEVEKAKEALKKRNPEIYSISLFDDDAIKAFADMLTKKLQSSKK